LGASSALRDVPQGIPKSGVKMCDMKELLVQKLTELAAILSNNDFAKSLFDLENVEINCATLTDTYLFDTKDGKSIYDHPDLKAFFNSIDDTACVIYWFRIKESMHSATELHNLGLNFKKNEKELNAVAVKKDISNADSNILYIGKTQDNFKGRLVSHLGYNKNKGYAGLQLYHWAPKELKLILEYVELPSDLSELAGYLELNLARKYKPILGKHRS
jgi:hypothetical protein